LIERLPSGARVARQTGDDADPIEVFAKLFEDDRGAVSTFEHQLGPREVLAAHRHTGPLAARVNSGAMAFVFGDERLDLEAGDFVWLPTGLAHEEIVTSDRSVDLLVAHVGSFDTELA
jgi:quercetin dioxygenase-like cupin family protein